MTVMVLRLLLVCCGGTLTCMVVGVGILYSSWSMSRRDSIPFGDNGWDR